MKFPNGDIYEGDYIDDVREGFGVLTKPNGDVYEANWVNDEKNGEGVYIHNGRKEKVKFKNDKIVVEESGGSSSNDITGEARDNLGYLIGTVDKKGYYKDSRGHYIGKVYSDGEVFEDGSKIGKIYSDGEVHNNSRKVGKIYDDGTVYNSSGTKIGKVDGDRDAAAILLLF